MVERAPTQEAKRTVATVRVYIRDHAGRILLLRKGKESQKAAGFWEVPGGQISGLTGDMAQDSIQILDAGKREALEEVGINLEKSNVRLMNTFAYKFTGKGEGKKINNRDVYNLLVELDDEPEVVINKTLNALGTPEDKHDAYAWVSPVHLWNMKEYNNILLGNTNHFAEFLGLPG